MFTLEIAGRAVTVTDLDEARASHLFDSEWLQDEVRSLESEGRPLWKGPASFNVRRASEEIDAFDDVAEQNGEVDLADNSQENEGEDGNGIIVPFLISAELPGDASARPN